MEFNHKREYDWLIISQSYFQCALINARILSKKLSKFPVADGSPLEYCLKEIYGNYPQNPGYLIFPIIFNFKHGIEIYLKSIIGIVNSNFSKGHNLPDILKQSKIENKDIEDIIKKYSFGHLFLPNNEKCDTENQFERYPQGSPYDNLELFTTINENGEKITIPEDMNLDGYLSLLKENNAEIVSIISQEKIKELIKDIEFLYKNIRQISSNLLEDKKIKILA